MTPLRGLAWALAATAGLFALRTLAFRFGDMPALPFHVAFAAADALLAWSLFRLRASSGVATLGFVLAGYELLADALGAMGHASSLVAAEPLVSLLLAGLVLLVLRSIGEGARRLLVATTVVLVVALGFRMHAMSGAARDPSIAWVSWGAELARMALLAATAFATRPRAKDKSAGPGGPYRAAQEMPPPSGDAGVDWGPFADALVRTRFVGLVRFGMPFAAMIPMVIAVNANVEVLGIVAFLAFWGVRSATAAILAESVGRARRSAPPSTFRALEVASAAFGVAGVVDLLIAVGFLLTVVDHGRDGDAILLAFPLSGVAGLVALGALGRALESAAITLERTDLLVRARRLFLVAVTIPAVMLVVMPLFVAAGPLGIVFAFVLLAVLAFAWIYGQIVQAGALQQIAAAADAKRG